MEEAESDIQKKEKEKREKAKSNTCQTRQPDHPVF